VHYFILGMNEWLFFWLGGVGTGGTCLGFSCFHLTLVEREDDERRGGDQKDINIVSTRIVMCLPSDSGDQVGGFSLPRLEILEWRAYSVVCRVRGVQGYRVFRLPSFPAVKIMCELRD